VPPVLYGLDLELHLKVKKTVFEHTNWDCQSILILPYLMCDTRNALNTTRKMKKKQWIG
jgi:hypothetical protein